MESQFLPWESFYVIVGSSAGALTGLQFVVIALGSESRNLGTEHEINAFATLFLPNHPAPSLFIIAASALLLLFTGIHNAWDAVIFLALARRAKSNQEAPPP